MMTTEYLLKPAVLGPVPEIIIACQEYMDAKRCYKQVYEVFEIELAFDFMIKNYIEIEKYIAEHLVLDMVGHISTEDAFRFQQWGFARTLNNWLASISFWRDLTRSRLIAICGRGSELKGFESAVLKLQKDEFVTAFLFHLRNYSQHGGFPLTGSTMGGSWDEQRTELTFSAEYTLNYDKIRSYFENDGQGSKTRKAFGRRIKEYSKKKPFDLKPIIRQSLGHFGQFMDQVRSLMGERLHENETFVLSLIDRYTEAHPGTSVIGLSVMPVDSDRIVRDKADIIPVRDEFILRAKEMRKQNSGRILASMEKRTISNR